MNPYFSHPFEEIEQQKAKLLLQLSGLHDPEFLHQPRPGQWSAGQILAHLITSEKMSLRYMKKKILGVEKVNDSGGWEEVKMVLLTASQRLPLKFKAPRVVVDQTPEGKGLTFLENEWDASRKDLKIFLEQIPEKYVRRKIYRHVRAGRLDARHAIIFFREHINHHLPQIRRILEN